MVRRGFKVVCPKCGQIGTLTYKRYLGYYINHGKITSHRVPRDVSLEVVHDGERLNLIGYPGGDTFLLPFLLKMIPPHICYVEVFGGGGVLLLNKPPSKVEVYNDIDGDLVNLFRVVKEKPEEFLRELDLLPYSRQLFYDFRYRLKEEKDPVKRAVMYFYVIRASHFGCMRGFGISKVSNTALKFFNAIDDVREVHQRLRNVVVEQLDFRECIKRYDSKNTFFYCDPPHLYILTEKRDDYYQVSFSEEDYMDLLRLLEKIEGKFLLKQSGVVRFVADWARERGFKVRELTLVRNLEGSVSKFMESGRREHWKVQFIANYDI